MPQHVSAEELAVARQSLELFSRGDMDRLAEIYARDACISRVPDGWPEPAPIVGREAVLRQYARVQEEWDEHSLTNLRECFSGEWLVIEVLWQVKGRASGAEGQMHLTSAFRFAERQIAEVRFYWDTDQALEDAAVQE